MDHNHYYTNEELEILLKDWAEAYPNLVELTTIGESYEKRPIYLLAITNRMTGSDEQKPAVWIDANIHATELAGTTAALVIAEGLLKGYGQEERLTKLLDSSTYYIVARINPDGAALAMAAKPRYIRSGVRPYPWDEREDGLHHQDIDGDGRILQMRLPDPNGSWKISTLDPRLMQKRDPDEHGGTYYRLLPEGKLEEFDGYVVKVAHPPEGLDFNRNFPFEWRTEGEQTGAGPYPVSEPEVRALVHFISSHPNINFAITFHTFSRLYLRPYSTKSDDDMIPEDLWIYKKIGEKATKLTDYKTLSTFHDFKYHPKEVTTGAFDDWMFDHLGVFSFTVEIWDLPIVAGIAGAKDRKPFEWWRDHPHEEDVQILKWADEHAGPGCYEPWRSFQHPQLGAVEIGGWNTMVSWRNPPPALLGGEVERHFPVAVMLGEMLPRLTLHTLETTPLGKDSYRINLVVENSGFLATYTSQQGKQRKAVRPVRAELHLPEGMTLVSGKRRVELGHLEGRSNDLSVTVLGASNPTDNRARAEWVVRGKSKEPTKVKVLSDRAGCLEQVFLLAEQAVQE